MVTKCPLLTLQTDDIKVLYNDWPYGLDEKIIHLVVWTKFDLEEDPATDDLTPKARKEVNDYVNENFCTKVPPDQVSAYLRTLTCIVELLQR